MISDMYRHLCRPVVALCLSVIMLLCFAASSVEARTYPKETWQTKTPEQVGLDRQKIDAIVRLLGGRGCIVRNGYVVKSWGGQSRKGGWMSSSKPVISTLLFFALQEGKGIIGAINYLARENVNLIYFLPMNIGGDGKNVWPFAGKINPNGHASNDNTHYDISKLRQREIAFSHTQKKGIVLHFVFNEAERNNKKELGTNLTTERKLFYREMIARFGHHNAILWNLCEEYNLNINLGAENVRAFARYIHETDPYDHPITVHHSSDPVVMLKPFIGYKLFSITSIQIGRRDIEPVVENFRKLTREAGRPIPIAVDEFTVTTHDKPWLPEDDIRALRIEKLWPAYLSGGQLEFIVGDLLETENFAKYEDLWRYIWHARKFLEKNVPFWQMEPADDLLEGESVYKGKTSTHDGQVFARPGQCYAIYFPSAQKTGTLDMTAAPGKFTRRWYNPRTGRFAGPEKQIKGGRKITVGEPPEDPNKDWSLLIKQM